MLTMLGRLAVRLIGMLPEGFGWYLNPNWSRYEANAHQDAVEERDSAS